MNFTVKFISPALLVESFRALRSRRYFVVYPLFFLIVLFGLFGVSRAARADLRDVPVYSLGSGQPFAIADFDGDKRPDFASIHGGQSDSSTDYWIQLQLTGSGEHSFRFDAPAGGLVIEARDVNGDHAVDLVLATAWFKNPVAILLNDGHGGFSRVEPASFPAIFDQCGLKWACSLHQESGAVGCPPQPRDGLCLRATRFSELRIQPDSIPDSRNSFLAHSFLIAHAGRAPPAADLHD